MTERVIQAGYILEGFVSGVDVIHAFPIENTPEALERLNTLLTDASEA